MAEREVRRLTAEERGEALTTLGGWTYLEDREAIYRRYQFADFVAAFGFMTKAALLAERADHHPEWSNVYDRVEIHLTTHDAGGVSQRDIDLAQALDAIC